MADRLSDFESLSKVELRALCGRLPTSDPDVTEECVSYFEAETRGLWHGRARAMMARRFKHCRLSPSQGERVVRAVLDRLASGRFSEQFRDQLRLVLRLDPAWAFAVARGCLGGPAVHVRRYAAWLLAHEPQQAEPGAAADGGA